MIRKDSDALECDLAQSYHIYDMRAFPLRRIALFASGLGEDSRIMKKLSGQAQPLGVLLQAVTLDALNMYLWAQSDGRSAKPKSVFDILTGQSEDTGDAIRFADPSDFESAMAGFRKEGENGRRKNAGESVCPDDSNN